MVGQLFGKKIPVMKLINALLTLMVLYGSPILAQDPSALAPILVGPYDGKDVVEYKQQRIA